MAEPKRRYLVPGYINDTRNSPGCTILSRGSPNLSIFLFERQIRSTLFIIFLARNSQLVPLSGSFEANGSKEAKKYTFTDDVTKL